MTRISLLALAVSCLVACGGPGNNATVPTAQPAGATFADVGEHVVHFNAQSTDQLPPEVASAYNIVRSRNRAMLTVSIIREADGRSVEGDVTVKTVNLTGQLKDVTMRRVEEPGDPPAIYYIGITPIANRETLVFDLSVAPEDAGETSNVRFKREFFTD